MDTRRIITKSILLCCLFCLFVINSLNITGCSSSAPVYDFRPQLTQRNVLPDREKIEDNGIRTISTFITSYVPQNSLVPGREAMEHFKEFDESGNLRNEINYTNDNRYYDKQYIYKYNDKGVQTGQESYLLPQKIKQNIRYTFDKYGNCTEEIKYDDKRNVLSASRIKYNSVGKKTEVINYTGLNDAYEKFTYDYDLNENNTVINYYQPVNSLSTKKVFKYDSNNNIVFEAEYNQSGIEQYKYIFIYGKENTLDTAKLFSESTGKITYIFHRDEDGYVRYIESYDNFGKPYCRYRYDYSYYYNTNEFAANSTLIPVSKTQVEGQLTAGYKQSAANYYPIKNFNRDNLKCVMSWEDSGGGTESAEGDVQITPKKLGGKNIASSILMDYSGSMDNNDRKNIQNAAGMFINRMYDYDEAQIIKFNVVQIIKNDFLSSKTTLLNAINDQSDNNLSGATALYDVINSGIDNVIDKNPMNFIRNVICLTDGAENSSKRAGREDIIRKAINNGIPVYTILYGEDESEAKCRGHYSPPRADGNYCEWDMWDIATKTGGFYFYSPKNSSDINDIYNSISGQLGNTFDIVITFPDNGNLPASGTIVTVTITVIYRGKTENITRKFPMP